MSATDMTETTEPPARAFYCPACGRRYSKDGTCALDHPSTQLLPLGEVAIEPVAAVPAAGLVAQTGVTPAAEPEPQDETATDTEESDKGDPERASLIQTAKDHLQSAIDTLARL